MTFLPSERENHLVDEYPSIKDVVLDDIIFAHDYPQGSGARAG